MSRLFLLLLVATAPLLAQTPASPSHRKPPAPAANDDKLLDKIGALQNRARQILKAELSRRPDPACNPEKLSNNTLDDCFAADGAITERNYQAFAEALKASLAIQLSDVDPKIFPPPSRNFATGEVAWRTFVNKTCAALGDTFVGGTISPIEMTGCHQDLTRQHMKDLNETFLKQNE